MSPEELVEHSRKVQFFDGISRSLTLTQAEQLMNYVHLLAKWSVKMSLVSSAEIPRIVDEHILDSWAAFQFVPRETHYLDIGSGAGLPGVVFAILCDAQVILLEPRVKRIEFLKEVRRTLELRNVEIVEARLEDWQSSLMMVAGVQRAVGREAEHFTLLKKQVAAASFSSLVAESWAAPEVMGEGVVGGYCLVNGARHKVVCST